jgi:hypothetical protein
VTISSTHPRSLRELQRWFVSATTGREAHDCAEEVAHVVSAGPALTAAARLAIYHSGYHARLVECLADDYPALRFALGEDAFEALCGDYVGRYPSRSRSLNGFGENMACHCEARAEPWAGFATDLAKLEWALVEIVHEPLGRALTADALGAIAPSKLGSVRLAGHRAFRLLHCKYPVNAFYEAFREGASPARPRREASAIAVYRDGLFLRRMDLEPRAALLLSDLLRGLSLEEAVAVAAARAGEDGARELASALSHWLESWVRSGFFQRIEAL